jgi:hypothetical protein
MARKVMRIRTYRHYNDNKHRSTSVVGTTTIDLVKDTVQRPKDHTDHHKIHPIKISPLQACPVTLLLLPLLPQLQ